jgi:hypothetical protein
VAHVLDGGDYRLARRAAGESPFRLPPFEDLALDPAEIWL